MNKGLLGKAKIPIAILSILLAAIFVVTFVLPSMAVDGSANEDGTYILTDKADYNPGETVYISGLGFTPSSTVNIQVTRPDGVDVCPISTPFVKCTDLPVTDESGSFSNYAYKLNGVEGAYVVDASGGTLSAQTTFTDSRTISGATLNGSSAVIASSSETITAAVTVTTSSSNNDWKSTAYRIGNSGSYTCVDTPDHTSSGTYTESFTITAPATTGVYDVSFIAYSDDVCSSGASGTYTLTNGIRIIQTNPQLSSSCGIDIALIIDNSGTIDNTELTTMKNAFKDFVDAFLPNTPTQMAVVKFNTVGDLVLDYSGDATTIKSAINSVSTTSGYTNWQDGLKEAYDEFNNRADKPDLYVFASDGQPNRYNDPAQGSGGGIDPAALVVAITTANTIKSSGVRIITLGIGTGGDQNFILNLKSISSNDAFYDTNFETLADTLAALADDLCGGTITVKKLVDGQPARGWTFDASATGGTVTPATSTTNGDGYINPAFDIEIPGSSATASVTENLNSGYGFVSASCEYQNHTSAGTPGTGTVTNIIVGKNDAVYCEFQNSMITCSSHTGKTSCDLDVNCDWCSQCMEPDYGNVGKAKVNQWHAGTCVPTGADCGYHCEVGYCNAECDADTDCLCPTDGCVGNDWYDYPNHGTCPFCPCICHVGTDSGQPCEPTISSSDPRCSVCGNGIVEAGEQCDPGQNVPGDCCNANCQFESNTYTCRATAGICDVAEKCSGSSALCPADIKSTALCRQAADQCDAEEYCNGISNDCPPDENAPLSTPCDDGLWCSATDHCDGNGQCVQLTPRNCSGSNLTKIETCDNIPDNYHFTWDFRNPFTSICNETNDSCTQGNATITNTCSVVNCTAECDATHSCNNKCVGNVWYSAGNCSLTTCNCTYSTQNCDLQDGCYVYQTGCENRDYFCQIAGCNYTFSNRSTDFYDAYVNYCSGDTIRKHSQLHNFGCDGTCKDNTSWQNDTFVQDCTLQNGWNDTGQTKWINETQCIEREQKEQKYRNYTCSGTPSVGCTYTNTSTQWVNTTNTRNKDNGTTCNDGLFCTVNDHCQSGQCQGSPRDCSCNNLVDIAQCNNIPDSKPFTFDYAPGFTSICNETLDICTNSTYNYTHTCADNNLTDSGPVIPVGDGVRGCTAECDGFGNECQNKCVGNIRYSGGNCSLTTCNCSYSSNENCDSQDSCYVYSTGCEDRNYFCQPGACNYTFSNRSTDFYDAYVNYCSADAIRTNRTFHDFYCGGTCLDHTSLVNDSLVENCNLKDGWYNTSTTQWISTGQCTEKEQIYQDNRDYTCSNAECTFSIVDNRWFDTGQTRNKPDTTVCDDNNYCTINDHCDGQGTCIGGGSYDCSGNNLVKVETCDWDPDAFSSTFDWRVAFTSECINTGNNTGHCTSGNSTIDHFCADENGQDGGPAIPVGDGIKTCNAECDGFGNECLPYLGEDDFCYIDGSCDASPAECSCSWIKDGYCPDPGTVIDGYCYWGERYCTENGCSLNKTLMGCNDECDPETGPKDTIGPTTTQLTIERKCNFANFTANVSNCHNVVQAEYFYDICPDKIVRGTPMLALDGAFDEASEIVYVNNVNLTDTNLFDGRHNIYIRGKDEFGNWGNCSAIGFDLDIFPPYTAEQHVEPQMACSNNVTVTALVCEPLFLNQSFICAAEFYVDNFTTANGEGIPMTPIDGVWGDDYCEWVTGTYDASQLIEGTHYVKAHGMDCFCNWGKIDFLTPVWFIRDTVHPITTKQLIPFNNESEQCYGNEAQDSNVSEISPGGLTNGCEYVRGGTQIVLHAQDQDTKDHEISDNVTIHWKVWYKSNSWDPWVVDQQGMGGVEQNVTIILDRDSYHLIEYWAVDSCGNEEPHHFELDIVDDKPPTITKIVGDPKIPCESEDPSDCVYFVRDHVTPIDLYCLDQQPHPVGQVQLWYRILLDGQVLQDWTDPIAVDAVEVHKQIIFEEDSVHTLQYYCVDALGNSEGTREQPHQQVYKVDSTAPNTTKTYGQPLVTTNGGYPKWINSSTPITLTAVDGGDVCHVGVDKTWYKDRVLTGEEQMACYNPQEYCKPQLLEDCQYCQNGNYPKECINQQQEYCTEEMGYDPYTEDWYNCVEEESQYHCCGGWDWKLYRNEPIFKPEESCHVLYYFSVDKLGNVENISVNCFFVDNTPPVSQKTVGEPKKQVDCSGLGEFTDGCYYINQSTPITLNCSDGQPHPVNDVKIWYKIDWKNESEDSWQDGEWIVDSDFITFNYSEDSYHRLTWYCVDALNNTEAQHTELDIVDTLPPVVTKEVGDPKIPCQGGEESSFFDNVEEGQDGWTASGLWHITEYRSYSSTHSWAYNEESSHDYDTGDTNSGSLISPSIVLGTNSQLKFWSWEQTECEGNPDCPYDEKEVYISEDGGSNWNKVWEGETEEQWYQVTIDLSAYAGKTIKVKFSFDTGDDEANDYEGWYVDNIEITGASNNCWYITQQTPITLTCYDQEPHPVDNEVIYWKYQLNNNGTWFEFSHIGTEVTFTYPEDSNHTLEYWCVDDLNNSAQKKTEIDIVDTQAPNTTKNIIGPQFYNATEEKLFLDGVTEIELTCVDPEPHPVDDVNIYYRYRVGDGPWGSWTLYTEKFKFLGESKHELEYYCIDALGNEEVHQFEIDYVDHTPPVTTKTYGQPYFDDDFSEWINSSTPITLSATDGTEEHASGVDNTYWRVTLVDDRYCSGEWNCNEALGSGLWNEYEGQFFIQDQSCHLIEFYSVDNVNKTEAVKKQCPYVENTPPVSDKTVGEPKHECTEGEWMQYGEPADGCWYINQSTVITLTCSDGQPHPVDDVNIYYRDYLLGETIPDFTLVQGGYVQISKNEDSAHVLEWYCTDALGNEEQIHRELDIVDSQYPNVTKTVGEPKVSCGDNCWYITNNTEITLDCNDGEPHPVDHVSTYYRYYLDGVLIQDWTLYTDPFKLLEYSNHTVQYYCKDILGNTGPIFTEEDKVDNVPPVIIPDPCYDIKSEDKVKIWAIITDDKVGIDETTTKAFILYPNGTIEELLLVYNSTTGRYEVEWTAPDLEGVYYVNFSASDLLGNSAYLPNGKFIIVDNTPPEISSVFAGRLWIGLGDKFYVDAEVDDNSVHFEEVCKPLKCYVRIVDNAGKDAYLEGQLEFYEGVLKCAGFVTVNDTFYEAQAQLWVNAIDGAGNKGSAKKLEPIGIDNSRMIDITGIDSENWFRGGQWINGVVATVDSSIFGEVKSCSVSISGVSPENTLHPVGNNCTGNIRIPTDISDGEKTLTIKATTINLKEVEDSVNIRIDNNAPVKQILSPTNGTYYSTEIPVVLNVTDGLSGVKNASFRIVKDPLVIFGLIKIPGTDYDSGWISTAFNGTTWNYTFNASNLTPGDTYYFLSLVCDNAGNCVDPLSYELRLILDRTPPSWPILAKLTITSSPYDKDGDVTLGWPEATDSNGVDHYDIKVNGILKKTTTGTGYTFTNLANGYYEFTIIPVDKIGNRGTGITGSTTVDRNCAVDGTCTPSGNSGTSNPSSGPSYSGTPQSSTTNSGTTETNEIAQDTQPTQECIPYWLCSGWTSCSDGKQTRKCVDKNSCIDTSKTETQDCETQVVPATGLLTLINSPAGYAVTGLFMLFIIIAALSRAKTFKKFFGK